MGRSATVCRVTAAPAPASAAGLTWEQFLALPDDDALRHAELVDGEVVLNPPTSLHQRVVFRMMAELEDWSLSPAGAGEPTMEPVVQVAPRRGYLPDVAWYPPERCAPEGQPPSFHGPPALAVEVLSPSTRLLDAQRKRTDYARVGVDELWLVDPLGPAILVLRREDDAQELTLVADLGPDDTLTSPLLLGFSVPVRGLVHRR